MLLSNLCDYSNANIVGTFELLPTKMIKMVKMLYSKIVVHLLNAHEKTNSTFTDKAEDLDMAMSMYYFLECSGNDSMTTVSL